MQKDNTLSKSRQLITEAKEASFESIISIFRYLMSKDIFETFYTKYLAERLLHRKSESQEKE